MLNHDHKNACADHDIFVIKPLTSMTGVLFTADFMEARTWCNRSRHVHKQFVKLLRTRAIHERVKAQRYTHNRQELHLFRTAFCSIHKTSSLVAQMFHLASLMSRLLDMRY